MNKIKLKYICKIHTGGTPKSTEKLFWKDELLWFTPEDIGKKSVFLENSKRKISYLGSQNSSAKIIKAPAIIMTTRAPVGNLSVSFVDYTTNQGCKSLTLRKNFNIMYIYYQLLGMREWLNAISTGTTFLELSSHNLKNIYLLDASRNQQDIICEYLNLNLNEIDSLIVLKTKQVELLKEQREAIITESITKGIMSNIKMKSSGIEWIGEVPIHWEILKIKNLFDIKKRVNTKENPKVLSMTQRGIKEKNIHDNSGQHAESYSKYQRVYKNDFVMNGMDLLTGYIDTSNFEYGVTSPDYRVFSLKNTKGFTKFYLLYFQMCYKQKIFFGQGQGVSKLGRWRLQTKNFKDFPIVSPPVEEQREIVNKIEHKLYSLDLLKEKLEIQILKYKEYRQSLIHEAVTGKIPIYEMEEYLKEVEEDGN